MKAHRRGLRSFWHLARSLAAVSLVLPFTAVAPASAAPNPDWVLVKAVAGPAGASDVTIRITARVHATGRGPLVLGHGHLSPKFADVMVENDGGDGLHVSWTRGEDTSRVDLVRSREYEFSYGSTSVFGSRIPPGHTFAILEFLPNAWLEDLRTTVTAKWGSPAVTERRGKGSAALYLGGPHASGTALSLTRAAAGSVHFQARASRGIVGAFDFFSCDYCSGEWNGPGRRSGTWSVVGVDVDAVIFGSGIRIPSGAVVFAGPAGKWSWNWEGVMIPRSDEIVLFGGSPLIAAWAPIADDWTLFDRLTQ